MNELKVRKKPKCTTSGRNPTTGRNSKHVQKLMKKLSLEPMKEVSKLEFDDFLEEMKTRAKAFDADCFIRKLIVDKTQSVGKRLFSEEVDLYIIQNELADANRGIEFYRKQLLEEQSRYPDSYGDEKEKCLARIGELQKMLNEFDRKRQKWYELKQKIQYHIDKKSLTEKDLEIKQQGSAVANAKNIDWSVFEEESELAEVIDNGETEE